MKFQDHNGIHRVGSFAGLMEAPLTGDRSSAVWQRTLDGDFEELARGLKCTGDVATISDAELRSLTVSPAGQLATELILEDLRQLREAGQEPELSCVRRYPRDPDPILPTDVYSFHVDSATTETDTFLCCYTSPTSEGLHRSEARRAVEVPAIRRQLLAQYSGGEGDGFEAYLQDLHYDLHFLPNPGARPFPFGAGHLWRLAVQTHATDDRATIHRAPVELPGAAPRLLLIS